MDINDLEYKSGGTPYYDPAFKAVVEDHMTFLRSHEDTVAVTLDAGLAYKWVGDLFGLMRVIRIDPRYFWTVMRMNHMTSPTDLNESVKQLLVPSSKTMRTLVNQYQTLAKRTT